MTDTRNGDADPSHNEPVPMALALLQGQWPDSPPLTDTSGANVADSDTVAALETDPRYLIGRLQQALSALLTADLAPMDTLTSLLSTALGDAISWRCHDGRTCGNCGQSLCKPCNADWDQADRYHALARALGAVGDRPPPRPR